MKTRIPLAIALCCCLSIHAFAAFAAEGAQGQAELIPNDHDFQWQLLGGGLLVSAIVAIVGTVLLFSELFFSPGSHLVPKRALLVALWVGLLLASAVALFVALFSSVGHSYLPPPSNAYLPYLAVYIIASLYLVLAFIARRRRKRQELAVAPNP